MEKRCIIAGGRDFAPNQHCKEILKALLIEHSVTEVISGMARGADMFGRAVALGAGIPVKEFPADWDKHGKAAGMIRNAQMGAYAAEVPGSICILFPGGKGTDNMRKVAMKKGLTIIDVTGG